MADSRLMIGTPEYFAKALSTGSSALFPVLKRRESTHTKRRAITSQDANKLRNVLSLITIHNDAVAMFECPTGATRFKNYWIAAQLMHTNLHRRARA